MSDCNSIDNLLKRNGKDQDQRFIVDLNPDNFQLHDFNIEDWMLFTYNFAKHVNYFSTDNDTIPSGNWQDFFNCFDITEETIPFRTSKDYIKLKENVTEVLAKFKAEGKLTPHLTLFVCFLQLLNFTKSRFNKLTKRHLDFYYKDILQVNNLDATPDQVHTIFELAKKGTEERVLESTALNAKKDKDGNPMIYDTNEELIVNKTTVTSLKSVYNDIDLSEIKASTAANTLDGLEEPLPEDEPYWLPFGYTSKEKNFTQLPDAQLGFALASPMLDLQEGDRNIEITINFQAEAAKPNKSDLSDFSVDDIIEILTIYCSGKENWLDALRLQKQIVVTNRDKTTTTYTTSITNNRLKLVFQLDKDAEPLVNYNPEFLLEKYDTTFPLIRFLIDTKKDDDISKGHDFYRALVNRIVASIKIKVDVRDAKSLVVENDFGVLKTKKPFYPFTTQPVKKSNFYINYAEAFSKNWKNINVNLVWKNTPDDFKVWYKAYLKDHQVGTKKGSYTTAIATTISDSQLIVTEASYFKAEKSVLHKEEWDEVSDQTLFTLQTNEDPEDDSIVYESNVQVSNTNSYDIDKSGPIRLSLNQTFLHQLFPRIYALALTSDAPDILIPNEPYTPLIENISIDYIAEETRTMASQTLPIDNTTPLGALNTFESYDANRIQLFHEHPFGQCEEHNYLNITKQEKGIKEKYDTNTINTYLVPKYCDGGALYIGLKDAEIQQTAALLIQVLEGSENPVVPSFEDNEKINWAVLCDNKWKNIDDDIISNSTDNFLISGIVKFNIPKQATKNNTQLPEDYIWVRARMHKDYDAVCKVTNIHAQAVLSTFQNNKNELSHLKEGLPAETIKKLITRVPQIKSVSQPYNSFNGIPKESDVAFYRRISERLRHKNRAITLWDCEHLILQQFPEIYKVKCLNHTKDDNFISAGNVTIVVIPDTVNKNVFDIFQPRVSKGTINKVKTFVNERNSMLVNADVINPNYEEVTITLEVQFHEGYDESFYIKQLEEDIIKFLSPWAFNDAKAIAFGVELHRSVLIDYLEKLIYVDYLQNIKMDKDGVPSNNMVSPANPKSILVSAKAHHISTVLTTCKGEKAQELTACPV